MNFLPLILGFLLLKNFNIFGNKTNDTAKSTNTDSGNNTANATNTTDGIGDILDRVEDAQQALQLVSILNKIRRNQADLTEVIGEIMNNPIAMNLINRFGFGNSPDKPQSDSSDFEKDFYSSKNSTATQSQPQPSFSTPPASDDLHNYSPSSPYQSSISNLDQNPNQTSQPLRQPPNPDTFQTQFNGNAKTFDSGISPADTLFKPVEKIAGVELMDDLKKYYENWYVK